jgi:DNA-binding response OmpR family regulator
MLCGMLSRQQRGLADMPYSTDALSAQTILVVEDHYLLADFVTSVVGSVGASIRGPFGSAEMALAYLLGAIDLPNAATLNIELSDGSSFPVADELMRMDIPFVFLTENKTGDLPDRFSSIPLLKKPFSPIEIVDALRTLTNPTKTEEIE